MPKCTENTKNPCKSCDACEVRARLKPFLNWSGEEVSNSRNVSRLMQFRP